MTTTTTTINAHQLALELLAQLPAGWQLSASMQQRIRENDSHTAQWADLEQPSTGATLGVQTSHHEGRIYCASHYPKDFQPYIDGRGRAHGESITVSMTKTPAQILKDIQRRLWTATNYFDRLAECMTRKAQSEQNRINAEALAAHLRGLLGVEAPALHENHTAHQNEEKLRTARVLLTPSYHELAEFKVAYDASDVDVKLSDLTPDEAEEVACMVSRWRNERAARQQPEAE